MFHGAGKFCTFVLMLSLKMPFRCLILSCLLCGSLALNGATVDTITVSTTNLVTPMRVVVVTPDKAATDTVPTLYLLHGYDGRYDNWIKKAPEIAHLSDQYGMLIVMPDGRDSWYWDAPRDTTVRMESFFVNDLVPYIDGHYRTWPKTNQRAITGLSMGGQGALWLAMRHPDIWASAGSMSGGVDIREFPEKWKMAQWLGAKDEYPEAWEEHSIINLVDSLQPGELNLTFDCGIDDFFSGVNYNLHQTLVAKGIPHDYTSRPGCHTWQYWRRSLPYHLMFFSEHFGR